MAIGSHRLEYDVVQGWVRLPEGWAFTEVVGVAVDSGERVFVFCPGLGVCGPRGVTLRRR